MTETADKYADLAKAALLCLLRIEERRGCRNWPRGVVKDSLTTGGEAGQVGLSGSPPWGRVCLRSQLR